MSFGVQTRPMWALVTALLKMDLRNQAYSATTRAKPTELIPPLYWVIGQFLATSALLSLALFTRVDAWFFAFANLTASAAMLFSALVVEFHEVVLDPADSEVLGHRPLTKGTYAAARLLNLMAYVAVMAIATAIFPAVLGSALRDSSIAFAPAYLVATAITALGVTALVVLLYTTFAAGKLFDEARGLLSWFQVGSILVLFYGGQLMLRNADGGLEYFAARPPEWLMALPTAFLARAVVGAFAWPDLAIAAALAFVLPALAAVRLASAWGNVHAGNARSSDPARAVQTAGNWAWATRNRHEAAAFWLTRTMLSRDQELKLRAWPSLAMALAALLFGTLSGQLDNPLSATSSGVVLSLAVPVLLAAAVPSLFQNVLFSRDAEASRLLALAPIKRGADLARGVRKALLWRILAPATVVLFVAYAGLWRAPLDALLTCAIAWLMIEHAARLAQVMVLTRLPFSRPITRGATLGAIALVSALASAAGMGVAALQLVLAGNRLAHLGIALGLVVLLFPADAWADRAAQRLTRRADG